MFLLKIYVDSFFSWNGYDGVKIIIVIKDSVVVLFQKILELRDCKKRIILILLIRSQGSNNKDLVQVLKIVDS